MLFVDHGETEKDVEDDDGGGVVSDGAVVGV